MLTVPQFAAKLGVSEGRIRQYIAEGRIPFAQKVGRDWLIPENTKVKVKQVGRPPRE